ncbi:MAG: amidohydrolase family protein, partial [Planctomycetes bacterium]|nr:amidohydrolase family protein [Planctomycetota bacterium]
MVRHSFRVGLSFCVLAFVSAAASAVETTVIDHVNLVDVKNGKLIENQRVVIEGENIARVEPASEAAFAASVRIVDGRGKYLLPGLFDSHVHYISPETFGPMMIAHGVTFVRDMGGPTEFILALRDQLNRGEVLGPEMIATGAIVDGDPPIWPFSEACKTADDARKAVRKLAKAGVDQIKVYSKLPAEAYQAAIDEAGKQGLKAVGHIPHSVTLDDAIDAGQATIEHLDGFDVLMARAAGEEVPLPRPNRGKFTRWGLYPKADKATPRKTYRRLRKTGVGMWKGERYARMSPGAKRTVPLMQQVVAELHEAGVTLLCGTDLANPNVIAGHSLHEEMALFQDAGVPAADVLRSATITPAEVFGVADRLGTVEPGKTASLVLVEANPLADVRNARKIDAVFLRGKYFDREALDKLLENAKRQAKGTMKTTETAEIDLSLPGEVILRGRYRSKFMNMDGGTEDFIITKTPTGFSIKAHRQPTGGPQP